MKLDTEESKQTFEKLFLVSSAANIEKVKDFMEALLTVVVLNYMEGKPTYIPFLGEIEIEFNGDLITTKGREAQVKVQVTPDDKLKRVVGQIQDNVENDIEKMFIQKMRTALQKHIEGN